jgi:hypothetical protein
MAVYSGEYYYLGREIAEKLMEHLERHRKASGSAHQAVLANLPDGKISLSCATCQQHLSDTPEPLPVEARDRVHESFNDMVEQEKKKSTQ